MPDQLLKIPPISLLPLTSNFLDDVPFYDLAKASVQNLDNKGCRGRPRGRIGMPPKESLHYSEEEIRKNPTLALTPVQYRTLRLHLAGMKVGEIAETLGITEAAVRVRLMKPAVKAAKAQALEALRDDVEALSFSALEVYREGLQHQSFEYKLKAADRVMKMNRLDGSYDRNAGNEKMDAEDLVSKMMAIQININNQLKGSSEEEKGEISSVRLITRGEGCNQEG